MSTPPEGAWAQIIEAAGSRQVRTMLENLRPISLSPAAAVLECVGPIRAVVESRWGVIEEAVRRVLGSGAAVTLAPSADTGDATLSSPAGAPAGRAAAAEEPEIVRTAVELFGARVVRMVPKEKADGD